MLEYNLDQDPTKEVLELNIEVPSHPCSAFLSAQFIHHNLFDHWVRIINGEPTNVEDDVLEFIEPAAIAPVGPYNEVTPSFAVDSAETLENWQYPGYGYLGLEGTVPAPDTFPVMTMDLFSQQPWGSNIEACQGHSSLDTPSELNLPQRIPSPLFLALLVPQAEG